MIKFNIQRSFFSLTCLLIFADFSMAIAQMGDKILISQPAGKICIDGQLDDWNLSTPVKLNQSTCYQRNGYVKDNADCSALLYSNFNDETLYFALEVQDDDLYGPYSGGMIWSNDGVELWLDNHLNSSHADVSQEDDDYQICVSYTTDGKKNPTPGVWVGGNPDNVRLFAGTEVASRKAAKGYVLEIALPVSGLNGLSTQPGQAAGFNISLVDKQKKGMSRLLWSGRKEKDPRQFGLLVFGEILPKAMAEIQKRARDARGRKLSKDKIDELKKKSSGCDRKNYKGIPKIIDVSQNNTKVECYEKLELTVDLQVEYDNPYDFNNVNLQAHFVLPSGKKLTIDGFYYQPHFANSIGYRMKDGLQPFGEPTWKVRFTPTEKGEYKYHLTLRDKQGRSTKTKPSVFQAVESDNNGFLRVSKTDPYYIEFDTRKPFYGIGYAVHEFSESPTDILKFMHDLNQIAAFGGNYLSVNFNTVATSPFNLVSCNDLTHFTQRNAWRTDLLLEASRRRGLYIIPNLVQTACAKASHWKRAPFNKDNGGPCEKPEDFFTNREAIRLTKLRFRYMIARWGYSPNILGWELFNEVNYTDGFQKNLKSVQDWHREMAKYLKKTDPNKHLVSTCFGSSYLLDDPVIWGIPDIDFVITHKYRNDATEICFQQWYRRRYHKPIIGGEFGMRYPHVNDSMHFDPEGLFVHNGLWTCVMTGSAGNVLFWWKSNYINATDAVWRFKPFKRFIKGIPWTTAGFEPIELMARKLNGNDGDVDMILPTKPIWKHNPNARYDVEDGIIWSVSHEIDKSITDAKVVDFINRRVLKDPIPALLFGDKQSNLTKDLIIRIKTRKACTMEIPIRAVSKDGAMIQIFLNGKKLKSDRIGDLDGKNDPMAKEFRDTITLSLPVGDNRVVLKNTGQGWLCLGDITLKGYSRAMWQQQAMVLGLQGKKLSLLWFHNRENNSQRRLEGPAVLTRIKDIYVTLTNVQNGEYEIEWWNTEKGKVQSREKKASKNGVLIIAPPEFDQDVACKIRLIE